MPEPHLLRAVRALLVDPDDRVLLVRFDLPDLTLWTAPGGGVDPGQSNREALARELHEEVGHNLAGDPPLVWHRPGVLPGVIAGYDGQVDDFYLVRCEAFQPRGDFSDDQLRATEKLVEVRWWTPAELAASSVVFAPRDLPARVAALLRGYADTVTVGL